jgi:Zn-dependent protease with chaperone function
MSREQFEALVRRLEDYARRQPGAYRTRVGALAALGYGYIFLILALGIALLAAVIWLMLFGGRVYYNEIKLIFILLAFVFVILRSLWVRFPPPEGVAIRRERAPRLFEMVDRLTGVLRAPRFHRIYLTADFNAAAAQRPRLGVLGWQENYLEFGLPLMQAVSPEHFRAVVAHELGHLSGNHGRFGGWIYRVAKTWEQLLENTGGARTSDWLFGRFFRWYVPLFNAYSFALRRANEYEADRAAAQLTGVKTTGEALVQIQVKGQLLQEDFWPGIYRQADHQSVPPDAPFTTMSQTLGQGVLSDRAEKWLRQALREKTGYADTHPSLSDRLAALGYRLPDGGVSEMVTDFREPVQETAASYFLGSTAGEFAQFLDASWKNAIAPEWAERYQYAQESRRNLATLEEKARSQSLTEEETWNRARWVAEFEGSQAALPLLREMLAANPDDARVHYALGMTLLQENDPEGIEHLDIVMRREPIRTGDCCESIYLFLKRNEREAEAEQYRKRLEEHADKVDDAAEERQRITPRDSFLPHGLTPTQRDDLVRRLARYARVKAAYLVRKEVRLFTEYPCYVLGIVPRHGFWEVKFQQRDLELVPQLENELAFDGDLRIFVLIEEAKPLEKAFRKVEGAKVYEV